MGRQTQLVGFLSPLRGSDRTKVGERSHRVAEDGSPRRKPWEQDGKTVSPGWGDRHSLLAFFRRSAAQIGQRSGNAATEWRKMVAHGASRGSRTGKRSAPDGATDTACWLSFAAPRLRSDKGRGTQPPSGGRW